MPHKFNNIPCSRKGDNSGFTPALMKLFASISPIVIAIVSTGALRTVRAGLVAHGADESIRLTVSCG
jgi:hypothetical protein